MTEKITEEVSLEPLDISLVSLVFFSLFTLVVTRFAKPNEIPVFGYRRISVDVMIGVELRLVFLIKTALWASALRLIP